MDLSKSRPLVGLITDTLAACLVAGILSFAGPCTHPGGVNHPCFGASRAILATAAVIMVLSTIRIFEMDEGERRGLDLGIALIGAYVALPPGIIQDLCKFEFMPCVQVMAPYTRLIGTLIAVVAFADLIKRLTAIGKDAKA